MYNLEQLFSQPKAASVFITAEIGINHQGNVDFAKKLIESAKESGADAVKFQIFRTDKFYNPLIAPEATALFKSFELSFDDFFYLKTFANSLDILFYATPLDFDSLDFLVQIKAPLIKIASSDITNEPFLKKISMMSHANNIPVCLSTGFVGIKAIRHIMSIFRNNHFSLLYCVSKYPTEAEDLDLNFIRSLSEQFFVPIGFSDHSKENYFSLGAVSLGARMIERHFTTDNEINGADHSMSLNPTKFSELVYGIRQLEKALGDGNKIITQFEKDITPLAMRSAYAARDIKTGERIQESDILLLRPGSGVKQSIYNGIVGKKSKRNIQKYEKI